MTTKKQDQPDEEPNNIVEIVQCPSCESYKSQFLSSTQNQKDNAMLKLLCMECGFQFVHVVISKWKVKDQ